MLYNKKWNEDISASGLVSWLETKNPEEEYNFSDPERCLIAQYLTSMGYKVLVGGRSIAYRRGWSWVDKPIPRWLDRVSRGPCTFGAALKRAKAE